MSMIDNLPDNSYWHGERVSAFDLILGAYEIKVGDLLKNAPDWAMTVKYNMTAKSDDATDLAFAKMSQDEVYAAKRQMMRDVLAERFKLKIHSEMRVSTIYEMVRTERTPKLMMPVQTDFLKTVSTCNARYSSKGVEVDSKGCSVGEVHMYAQAETQTEVLDHTGMTGLYAYHLMWSWPTRAGENESERYPQFVDAVREQLGLEMRKTQGPVTFWVVDHLERPTEN